MVIEQHIAVLKIPEEGVSLSLYVYGNLSKTNEKSFTYIFTNSSDGISNNPLNTSRFYYYDFKSKSMRSSPHFESLTIFGTKFNNVYSDVANQIKTQRYRFNFDVGIVSFEDRYLRLYVFDSFQ